jgi:rubrerythrin
MAQALDVLGLVRKLALIENEGASFYESLAQHTASEKVRKLARTMARVERGHQQRFEDVAQKLEKRKSAQPPDKLTASVRQYLLALIDHRIFLDPEQARILATTLNDENEAVDIAIRFEKENILLLAECREIVRGATRKLIERFIEQERAHIRSLQRIRQELRTID